MNVVSFELGIYNGVLEIFFYIIGLKIMNRDFIKFFFYLVCLWCFFVILFLNWLIIIWFLERKIIKGFIIL